MPTPWPTPRPAIPGPGTRGISPRAPVSAGASPSRAPTGTTAQSTRSWTAPWLSRGRSSFAGPRLGGGAGARGRGAEHRGFPTARKRKELGTHRRAHAARPARLPTIRYDRRGQPRSPAARRRRLAGSGRDDHRQGALTTMSDTYDLATVGGGPAGASAAIFA